MDSLATRDPQHRTRGALTCPAPPAGGGIIRYGLDQFGCFYQYGDSYATPSEVLDPSEALVFDRLLGLAIAQRKREYLDLGFVSGGIPCMLSLPCGGLVDRHTGDLVVQLPVCSLLGALVTLDLPAISGTLSARVGNRPTSNGTPRFIDVHVNDIMPELPGLSQARAPMIGRSREDLLDAVDTCRALFARQHRQRDPIQPRDPGQYLP